MEDWLCQAMTPTCATPGSGSLARLLLISLLLPLLLPCASTQPSGDNPYLFSYFAEKRVLLVGHKLSASLQGTQLLTDLAADLVAAGAAVHQLWYMGGPHEDHLRRQQLRYEVGLVDVHPNNFDLIVANTLCAEGKHGWMAQERALYGRAFSKRLVWWVHQLDECKDGDGATDLLQQAAQVVFLSRAVQQHWLERLALRRPRGKMVGHHVVYHALEGPWLHSACGYTGGLEHGWQAPSASLRFDRVWTRKNNLGVGEADYVLLHVGGLDGLSWLLQAFAQASTQPASAEHSTGEMRLALFGAEITEQAVDAILAELPPGTAPSRNNIRVLGHVENLRPWYAAADVFLAAWHCEAASRQIPEAGTMLRPVLAGRCGKHGHELVVHNATGLLHGGEKPAELARQMRSLDTRTPGGLLRGEALARGGCLRAHRLFGKERELAEWERLAARIGGGRGIRELINGGP